MFKFNMISLCALVIGALVLAFQLPAISPAARIYPTLLIGLVVLGCVVVAIQEIGTRDATPGLDPQIAKIFASGRPVLLRLAGFVVIWVAYPFAMSHLGFLIATTAALGASLWALQERRIVTAFVASAVFTLVFSVLFATVLFIPMPQGPLDELLSETLYGLGF